MKAQLIIYIKGMLMGIADLIPGISGGTIAFITGIYERLISAVAAFNTENAKKVLSNPFSSKTYKEVFKELDLLFLIFLLLGVGTSILGGAHIMSYLYTNYTPFVLAFFIGLILASCKIILSHIDDHALKNHQFALIGLFFGVLLYVLKPAVVSNPSHLYVMFGGLIAIAAMFLPGISGSFILLIFGLYEFMINAIKEFYNNLSYILMFVLGAILGALTISRVIKYFFTTYKARTLYFLLGSVIGSLSVPLDLVVQSVGTISVLSITTLIGLFLLGIGVVLLIEKLAHL